MNRYLRAYAAQKHGAMRRGIEFHLSFEEWMAFWGEDIDRRGTGQFDLQMQRNGDAGPYALGNISKGTPHQNRMTAGAVQRNRASEQAAKALQASLDRAMFDASCDHQDETTEDEQELAALGYSSSFDRQHFFAADKDR